MISVYKETNQKQESFPKGVIKTQKNYCMCNCDFSINLKTKLTILRQKLINAIFPYF